MMVGVYRNVFGETISRARWRDMVGAAKHYPNVLAGMLSTHPGVGDINEALSTLWYHDHRIDFTAQNTYKGLFGSRG